ncbi:A24 family peptidase [Rossellomorea sp. NS-SX7]|uniref:A24 family peptidase n=1 Tax=Rossellomorea sp. NS-SX7 TaxID=3463856 RepID=UPI00405868E9
MILIYCILCLALLISLITDIKSRKILNVVTFPAILSGLIFYSITQGWDGFFFSSLGLLAGMAALLIPFLLGGMGAGDVKLMGAVGALMGTSFTLQSFVSVALLGGLISVSLIIHHKGLFHSIKSFYLLPALLMETKGKILIKPQMESSITFPYGVPIVLGTLFNLVWSVAM